MLLNIPRLKYHQVAIMCVYTMFIALYIDCLLLVSSHQVICSLLLGPVLGAACFHKGEGGRGSACAVCDAAWY